MTDTELEELAKEEWKYITGYEGVFEVSSLGRIRRRYNILKQSFTKDGYKQICLSINNIPKTFRVHRLVASAFIPNIHNKPCVNHLDSNKENNCIQNLEWCTHSDNIRHSFVFGTHPKWNKGLKMNDEYKEKCRQRAIKASVHQKAREVRMADSAKRKICKHAVGLYHHSLSKICDASHSSDMDGLAKFIGFYNYCHRCGRKISKLLQENFWRIDYEKLKTQLTALRTGNI